MQSHGDMRSSGHWMHGGGGRAYDEAMIWSAHPSVKDRCCMLHMYMLTDSGQLVLRVRQPVPPLSEELEGDGSVPEDDDTCGLSCFDMQDARHATRHQQMPGTQRVPPLAPERAPGMQREPPPGPASASGRGDHHSSVCRSETARLTCVEGTPEPRWRCVPAAELLVCPRRCDIGSRLDLGGTQKPVCNE